MWATWKIVISFSVENSITYNIVELEENAGELE